MLKEVQLIEGTRHFDHRGYFTETYSQKLFKENGIFDHFVQDNESLSVEKGTLRGLHFQAPPHAQAKLVRCVQGSIFDVAVDIRACSPSYGQWVGYELSAENGHQLYIPTGFAHGFLALTTNTKIVYRCSDYYAPESEGSLRWDDPDINVQWPMSGQPIVSFKDEAADSFAAFESPFTLEGAV